MAAKEAIGIGWMAASAPPQTTTSALPERISSRPMCMASVPEAQAETGVWAPARAPRSRRHGSGRAVGHQHGYGHGQDAAGALFPQGVPGIQQGPDAADAGGEGDGQAVVVDLARCRSPSRPRARQPRRTGWRGPCASFPRGRGPRRPGWRPWRQSSPAGCSFQPIHRSSVWAPETPLRAFVHMVGTSPPMGVVAPRPVMTTLRAMLKLSTGWGETASEASARSKRRAVRMGTGSGLDRKSGDRLRNR